MGVKLGLTLSEECICKLKALNEQPKKDKVTGGWKRWHSDKLQDFLFA
jgi:hypothetical protein